MGHSFGEFYIIKFIAPFTVVRLAFVKALTYWLAQKMFRKRILMLILQIGLFEHFSRI